MADRPMVTVYNPDRSTKSQVALPSLCSQPIRLDIVHFVHTQLAKNARQAQGVKKIAGEQTSAESWGTGRAVARIPRVRGGGTHRSGQAAFGNMCRGGRMFAPLKTWRRWHRKANVAQRRYAVASAITASAQPALVMARGHRIEGVPEIPLVVSDEIQDFKKTKAAQKFLETIGDTNVSSLPALKKKRAGRGSTRGRSYKHKKGPLVIYHEDNGIVKSFRNLPGVDLCSVKALNLLQLAPGGVVGRFLIWTESALNYLNDSEFRARYDSITPTMSCIDLQKVMRSDSIQGVLNDVKTSSTIKRTMKKNPLKNISAMLKLNPYRG